MKDLFYALTLALICWGFGGCTGDAANDDPSPEYAELLPGVGLPKRGSLVVPLKENEPRILMS